MRAIRLKTGPQLEKAYIATGQVVQIFRNYPIPSLGHKKLPCRLRMLLVVPAFRILRSSGECTTGYLPIRRSGSALQMRRHRFRSRLGAAERILAYTMPA